jgi:proteic killer suppression protein
MPIRNALHKGLRRFNERADAGGLQPAIVGKISRMVSFLQNSYWSDSDICIPIGQVVRKCW